MVFGRASFNITPDIQIYGEASWVQAHTDGWDVRAFNFGNLSVHANNPFLPASVADRAATLGLTTLTVGSFMGDIPPIEFFGVRDTVRLNTGLNGAVTLFGKEWSWNAYFQYGTNSASENGYSYQKSHLTNALDAVISPASGAIVCRSTLTDPGNGCVPYNIFGTGVNSPAAVSYVMGLPGDSFRHDSFNQTVEAASIQGEPFSDWAGPVSLALGIEHRREAVNGFADPASARTDWYTGNYLPTVGSFNVTEGFVETVVPLAKDLPFVKSLDLNLALRATSYSTSGYVNTYKIGATWSPVDDIKFRFTRSRDIRAPNLSELYAAGTAGTNTVMNPFTHNTDTDVTITTGNIALKPEKADTTGTGIVLSPRWVQGLNLSVDYYNIHIRDAIGNINQQQIVNNCFAGQQVYCAAITFGAGQSISIVHSSPFNISSQIANGIDFEGSYTMEAADLVAGLAGSLDFRALATHYIQNKINNPFSGAPYNTVGINDNLTSNTSFGPPRWVYQFGITYSASPLMVNLTGRGISSGVFAYSNYRTIGCASGCPASTTSAPTIADNHVPGAFYLDASFSYDIGPTQVFLAVKNVFNTDPAILPSGTGVPNLAQTNVSLHDVMGRTFRTGVRFKF
jgi:outer membrane receptor protein involved in Fe transport